MFLFKYPPDGKEGLFSLYTRGGDGPGIARSRCVCVCVDPQKKVQGKGNGRLFVYGDHCVFAWRPGIQGQIAT